MMAMTTSSSTSVNPLRGDAPLARSAGELPVARLFQLVCTCVPRKRFHCFVVSFNLVLGKGPVVDCKLV